MKARIGQEEVRIFQEEEPISPREWDNLGHIVMWHKRYSLPQEGPRKFKTPQEFRDYLTENKSEALVIPVYMYDHSGVWLSTERTYPFNDPWDAGQVGYIYVTHEEIKKEYGELSADTLLKATRVLVGEIETYSQYMSGDVWGFVHVKFTKCNLDQEHETVLDSCYGFYGSNIEENGILEQLGPEWKSAEWQDE